LFLSHNRCHTIQTIQQSPSITHLNQPPPSTTRDLNRLNRTFSLITTTSIHHRRRVYYHLDDAVLSMEIVAASLMAVNRESRPQIIPIIVQPNRTFTIGRSSFTSRDDTIISRRHARFNIVTQRGPAEGLFVTN